jgi:hypothetical protein
MMRRAILTSLLTISLGTLTLGSSGYLEITATSGDIYMVADGILTSLYNVYDYTFEIAQQ